MSFDENNQNKYSYFAANGFFKKITTSDEFCIQKHLLVTYHNWRNDSTEFKKTGVAISTATPEGL
jgi:hypothetical protein